MNPLNTAQKILESFGGTGVIMASGWYVDRTTQPKPRSKNKVSYGKTLMSVFDIKRKELKQG
jgi:hypothetical protein